MMRAIRKEGWVPKHAKVKDYAAILGASFAAGVGAYYNFRKEHVANGLIVGDMNRTYAGTIAMGLARRIMDLQLERLNDRTHDDPDGYREKMGTRLDKAISRFVAADPIPDAWEIVDIEKEFPEHGNSRADLIIRDDMGLAVVDFKMKVTLVAAYREKTIDEFNESEQKYHYAMAAGETYGEPVQRFYIGLVVAEPFRVSLIPQAVNQESLQHWRASRERVWALMHEEEQGHAVPFMAAVHHDRFGRCPYYDACFTHRLDPSLMTLSYMKEVKDESRLREDRRGDREDQRTES